MGPLVPNDVTITAIPNDTTIKIQQANQSGKLWGTHLRLLVPEGTQSSTICPLCHLDEFVQSEMLL